MLRRMTGHFVHPFDDDGFISGNGTAGLEILEDLPDVDAIVAPLGGGGLLSGIGRGRGRCGPRRVYAAEPGDGGAARLVPRRRAARAWTAMDGIVCRRGWRKIGARGDVAADSRR